MIETAHDGAIRVTARLHPGPAFGRDASTWRRGSSAGCQIWVPAAGCEVAAARHSSEQTCRGGFWLIWAGFGARQRLLQCHLSQHLLLGQKPQGCSMCGRCRAPLSAPPEPACSLCSLPGEQTRVRGGLCFLKAPGPRVM